MILLTNKKIVLEKIFSAVRSKKYGAVVLFIGEVRDRSGNSLHKSKKVVKIEYSAYPGMALKQMNQIKKSALKKWKKKGIGKIAIVQRLGKLGAGEISTVAAVSSAHRKEAFDTNRFVINEIKRSVPVFKKEFFGDGKSRWVG